MFAVFGLGRIFVCLIVQPFWSAQMTVAIGASGCCKSKCKNGGCKCDDRKKMCFGLKYTCSDAISKIDDWLYDKCQGNINLVIDDMDDQMWRKTFKLMLELEKTKFCLSKVIRKDHSADE